MPADPAPVTPRAIWEEIADEEFQKSSNSKTLPACPELARPELACPELVEGSKGHRGFTVLNALELLDTEVPPKTNVLGDGVITLGQLTTVIGQGGTGKSRFVMQLALSQVLGLPVADLPTHPEPLRHLLIGTENSIHRQKHDLQRMTSNLTDDQRNRLGGYLYFHVIKEIDDAFICIGSEDIRDKWLLTLEEVQPNCIYIDPFGEVNMGDINKDADVRQTLRELTRICRRYDHDTAIIIVHHARTGRHNIAQAVGWDKSNFALGSKALYSGARCQINIAPADPEDNSRIVVSCGKYNDGKPFDPVGLKLNADTMLYEPDSNFDLQTWKDDVEGKVSGQTASIKDVINAIDSGSSAYTTICRHITDTTGCSLKTAKRRITDSLEKDYVRKGSNGKYFLTQKSLTI